MSLTFKHLCLAAAAIMALTAADPALAKSKSKSSSSSSTSAKSSACYSQAELEAETYIRLHSQLMVIAVTCHKDSSGNSLVPAYTGFTKNNITALHGSEATMQSFYKANYGGNGQSRLDDLRTKLANYYGQETADQGAPVWCGKYEDKPTKLASASPEDVKAEVVSMESGPTLGHLCAK